MSSPPRTPLIQRPWWEPARVLFAITLAALCLFVGLGSYGIWDPSELDRAELARTLLSSGGGATTGAVDLDDRLITLAFSWFGTTGWSGRIPMALAGLLTVVLAAGIARLFDKRAAAYTAAITAFNALFLTNTRHMMGHGLGMFCQALVVFTSLWLLLPAQPRGPTAGAHWQRGLAMLGFGVALWLTLWSEGALLGLLPPLVAVAGASLLSGRPLWKRSDPFFSASSVLVFGSCGYVVVRVVGAVVADGDAFSVWLGGKPQGIEPPTFELGLETVFHAFAPWSALLPVALSRLAIGTAATSPLEPTSKAPEPDPAGGRRAMLGPLILLWVGLGYGSLTLFGARYGEGTFLPVVALSLAVAMLFVDAERFVIPWRTSAIISLLFGVLLLRDYALYPESPLRGVAAGDLVLPDASAFNPRREWAVALGAFAATAFLGFWAPSGATLALTAPYRLLRSYWQRSLFWKLWLGLLAAVLAAVIIVGLLAWTVEPGTPIGQNLIIPSIVVKAARSLGTALALAPALLAGAQLLLYLYAKLGASRMLPNLIVGVGVGLYVAWGFVPSLSDHLSPRAVFERYRELAGPDEPLAQFRIGGRVASYYTGSEVTELSSVNEAMSFLQQGGRRWLLFPADDLAAVNKAFRKTNGEHLFVADATSAKILLAANQPVPSVENQNFLAKSVLSQAPTPMHSSDGRFEQAIELLGYDLELPREGFAGAGDDIVITWYWKAIRPSPGSFKIFLHIDGQGHRLNGDHDPVDGKYPVHLWEAGDIVVDRQKLTVPGNYRPGVYTLYIGFFQGSRRLKVDRGRQDGVDRLIAGQFEVR